MDIQGFWHAVLSQDREALPLYFHEDARIAWHCSNEQFTVSEYVQANCTYPGHWSGAIERIEEAGDTIILAGRVFSADGSASFHVVSFLRVDEHDAIVQMDEYWADDGQAPAWRRDMHIGRAIRSE